MGRKSKSGFKGVSECSKSSIQITFEYQGHTCREPIKGEPNDANFLLAYNFLCEINAAIADGTFDYAETFRKSKRARRYSNRRLLYTYLKNWLKSQTHLKSGGRGFYERIIEGQVNKSPLAKMALTEIRWGHARDWAMAMDVTPKTRSDRVGMLRTALTDALDEGLVETNHLLGRKLKRPRVTEADTKKKIDPYSWDERTAILSACKCDQFRHYIQFMFWSGLRPEEARALTWDRVDFVGCTVYINRVITDASKGKFELPKTAASIRMVELEQPAMDALKATKQYSFMRGDFIFLNPKTGEPYRRTDNIRDRWVTLLRRAGVRYRIPYQMRHTYASTAITAGENIEYISMQLGHEDINVTWRHYARFIPDNDNNRGKKLMAAYEESKNKKTGS